MTVLTSGDLTSDGSSSATSGDSIETALETWLKERVFQLSVDTLKSDTVTCTACGEVLGTYIVEYRGNRFRYSLGEAYAFLSFVRETQAHARSAE
jgi:hypothetical protein